jgi:hypothetical protein
MVFFRKGGGIHDSQGKKGREAQVPISSAKHCKKLGTVNYLILHQSAPMEEGFVRYLSCKNYLE